MDEKDRQKQGMAMRRAVLGDAHVDRAERNKNEFNGDFQDIITRYGWGEIWTRPGLDKRTRSLVTIAMLVALNREAELRMHLRAAANTGVTRAEIKELLMHSALYCGLPTANSAIHLAEEVFATTEEWRKQKS
jgi:4-carboxymuconolactone decarboxylase